MPPNTGTGGISLAPPPLPLVARLVTLFSIFDINFFPALLTR